MSTYPNDSGLHLPCGLPLLLAAVCALTAPCALQGQNPVVPASPAPASSTTPASKPAAPAAATASLANSLGGDPSKESADITFKFREDTVDQVLNRLEFFTGRIVIHPQQLPAGSYTITVERALTRSEAILAIETMLNLNGIAVVPLGEKFLKVVPLTQARVEAPMMIEGSTLDLEPSGRIASKLFQLNFLRAQEFQSLIGTMLNANLMGGTPAVFDRANALLITDSISNLQRIEALLQKVDQPTQSPLGSKFYSLKFAKASDIVTKMRTLFQSQPMTAQLGAATTYSADDRTNQVIVICDARQYSFFDEIIGRLDVKADPNTRNEIIPLRHATADDVAKILTQLVTGQNNAARSAGQDTTSALRQSQQAQQTAQPPGQPAAPATAAQPTPTATAGIASALGLGAEPSNQFSAIVTILSDARSNSIVVSGTVDDIRLILGIVDKLDVLLAQVSIQVIIAEVTLTDTDVSGLSALGLTFVTDTTDGSHHGTHIGNFTSTLSGWSVSSGVVNPLSFEAALGNTGSKSRVHILQTPTIVTTHNKEAEVKVGEQRPIITGVTSTALSGNTTSTSSTVTYKDIAIDLKVTPLIGDDGSVQLKIDQRVDDMVGTVTVDSNDQPIIGNRQATSFINVQDGQIIVLGGLQRTKFDNSRTKLGLLYEIPLLSQLLGSRTNTIERTELLIFVRPHVLKLGEVAKDTTTQIEGMSNKDQIKQFLADPTKQPEQSLIEKYK